MINSMAESYLEDQLNQPVISDEAVIKIVGEELPRWKAACDNRAADLVILNQLAFGKSSRELFLLGVAVKYAAIANKDIMISK